MKNKTKYYKKSFLLSYLAYLTSIIILLIMIVNNITSFLESEIEANVESQMSKAMAAIENNFKTLDGIAINIGLNDVLLNEPENRTGYNAMRLCGEIEKNRLMSHQCREIFLYYRNSDSISNLQGGII